MLRCAGCGQLVSEWAARCPTCGRATDDAEDLGSPRPARVDHASESPPVVADVEEVAPSDVLPVAGEYLGEDGPAPGPGSVARPPHWHPARRSLALVSGCALVIGATVGAVVATSGSGPRARPIPAAARHLTGRVISLADDGMLFVSHPDGSHRTGVRPGPTLGAGQPLFVDSVKGVVAGSSGRRGAASTQPLRLPAGTSLVGTDPLADGGRAVVVESRGARSYPPVVTLVMLNGGRAVDLGPADAVAGDPQSLGAFVAVLAPNQFFGALGQIAPADTRVELRRAGSAALVVATAAQLNQDAGQAPGEPVNLGVYPDRDGQKLAVVLNPVGSQEADGAVVILSRDGRLLRSVASSSGPSEFTAPVWSPDGTSLAYATFDPVGTGLAVVSGQNPVVEQGVQPATSVAGCTWSPDSKWVVCLAADPFSDNWLLANNDLSLTPIYSVPAQGVPVAWIQ